jgi:hypothetical protein
LQRHVYDLAVVLGEWTMVATTPQLLRSPGDPEFDSEETLRIEMPAPLRRA